MQLKFLWLIADDLMSTEPRYLYHYTSLDSLIKIIGSGIIWASNIHYLNDGREFAHALEVVRTKLNEYTDDFTRDFFSRVHEMLMAQSSTNVFVASFSEDGDLLSQWRAYCPPGRGVSIGFDESDLRQACEAQGFRLVQCTYNPDKQSAVAVQMVDELIEQFIEVEGLPRSEEDFGANCGELASIFVENVNLRAPEMKDPAFAEEREWRIVSRPRAINDQSVNYREGRSFIVPYLEFQLPVLRIPTVREDVDATITLPKDSFRFVIGPTPHRELSESALSAMLFSKGLRYQSSLRPSNVPYRSW